MEFRKEEEMKKRVVMWKHWVIAFVCFVFSCFHFVCSHVFGTYLIYLKFKELTEMKASKRPYYPVKETLLVQVPMVSLVYPPFVFGAIMVDMLISKAVNQNIKALLPQDGDVPVLCPLRKRKFFQVKLYFDYGLVPKLRFRGTLGENVRALMLQDVDEFINYNDHERRFYGTRLYEEAAWDFTELNFKFCAGVYAVALVLQYSFNMLSVELFSIALGILFSSILGCFFGKSCHVNLMIALQTGKYEQDLSHDAFP